MTETTTPPLEPGSSPESEASERLPLRIRLLGAAAVVLALVALYAVVQATGGEDPPAAAAIPGAPLTGSEPLQPGDVAPDFSVPTLDGGRFTLSEHLTSDGRPVFVNMWAEWCFPCRAEMPAVDAAFRARPDIHFIGVVVRDEEAPARRFVEEYEIGYQIGLDTDRAVESDYLVWVMPSTYLVGSDGTIIERFFGPITEEQLDVLLAKASA
jgi:thiol-disulfide isomerase/thioredoxin